MENKKYVSLAENLIESLGTSSNIRSCQHCVTRLRFNVHDKGLIDQEKVESIPGVLGTNWLGDQFQVVIGLDAKFVYKEVINKGVASSKGDEEDDGKFTVKKFFNKALDYVSSVMTNLIPIMIAGGVSKTIAIILGPSALNVISDTSDLYIILMLLSNAMMYFLPIFAGYTASKSLGVNPLYGMFLGALLLAPDLRNLIGVRENILVFFANAPVADYSQAFLPIVLATPILKYVLLFFEKYIPKLFSILLVPACTMLVMTFILYVVCGPIGSICGNAIGSLFSGLYESNVIIRAIGSAVICISWPFLIILGMHMPIVQLGLIPLFTIGYDTIIWPTAIIYTFVIMGIGLGAALKIKDKEEKGAAFSAFITSFFGGISEPTIYGIVMKYRKGLLPILIGSGIGGLLCGFLGLKLYNLAGLINCITFPILFAGGETSNLVAGCIVLAVSFVVAAVCAFFMVDYENEK